VKIRNAFVIALGFAFAAAANAVPSLSVVNDPAASVGQTFTVAINLNVPASETVSFFQFDLNFDPLLMDVLCSGAVCGSRGDLNGSSSFFDAFNSSSGVVTVADLFDIVGSVGGTIARVDFVLKAPTSGSPTEFSLSDVILLDPLLDPITNFPIDGSSLAITAAVPVPGTAALLGLGLGLLGWMRRRPA